MTLDPIIEDAKIPEIINSKYFSLQEQLFWLFARQTGAIKIDNESYSVHVNADDNFPDTRYNFTMTLPNYIADDIGGKFEELKVELNRYIVNLTSESAKKNFVYLIISQLKTVGVEVKSIKAPDSYKSLIINEFNSQIKNFERDFEVYKSENSSRSREWTVLYPQLGKPAGNEKFKAFHEKLVEHKLISEKTSYQKFKKFFKNITPEEKLIWSGSLSEMVTFFRELNNCSYVEVDNHWKAFKECFVFSEGRTYSLKNINGEKGTQSSRKQDIIEEIVSILK